MANIFTNTEALNLTPWTFAGTGSVTANTHAAPDFAGPNAGLADTWEDSDTAAGAFLHQTKAKGSNDTSDWVTSIYIQKDAITNRFPEILMEFRDGGTSKNRGVRFNTSTGATAPSNSFGAPVDHGVIDVDANWWRLWMKEPDNATGNANIRLTVFAARAATLTGSNNGTLTGSVVLWGANATKTTAVQTYEPEPFYEFDEGWTTIATLGPSASSHSDTTVVDGTEYDYRILATNAGGASASNIVTATAGDDPAGVSLPQLERQHRARHRGHL